jgi:hypothetical protein
MTRDKEWYLQKEVGQLRGRLEFVTASRDHYFKLVGERTKQLQRKAKECRALKRLLRQRSQLALDGEGK